MSSGKQLCDALTGLGYDGEDPLDPDSLEWPFQHDEARRLMGWICSRLRPGNVLSASDLAGYEQLEQEGKLLEGEDLDCAVDSISAFLGNREKQEAIFLSEERLEDIREAKLAFKAEVSELQKQLASLESQLDFLSAQTTVITRGKKARTSAKTLSNGQLTRLDEVIAKRNLEMNAILGKLAATTQELSYYHSEADSGIYLSYCDLQSYVISHLACTKELNKWFSKKFEKGPLHLVAREDESKYSWASINQISDYLVRGDSEKSHQFVAELKRINSIFAKSHIQYIEAQVANAKEQAMLLVLRTQLSSQQSYIHQDIHSLRRINSELAGDIKDLSLQIQKFLSKVIPCLCAELAELRGANILQGDHDLKVMRQECYINQQKRFINHLVNQLADHQFMKIACQLERQAGISSVCSLLKVIQSELQSYLSTVHGRLDHYSLIGQAASEMLEEGSVDDRDNFLHAVRDIISSDSSAHAITPTYVSAYGLVEQISELRDDLNYLQHEHENVVPRELRRCIDELCRMIHTLEQVLSESLTNMQPKLTPWPLMLALEALEKINQQVSACVNEVTMARDTKAEMLQQPSRNAHKDRQVFIDFFCHPGRLEYQVRELTACVRSLPE